MNDQGSAKDVIDKYQKKQERTPRAFVLGAVALILIFAGVLLLITWYRNPDVLSFGRIVETPTLTPTLTITPSPVPPSQTPVPPTATQTPSDTPTITNTPTIEGPFIYTVQEGNSLFSISEKFNVDINRLMEVNDLTGDSIIFLGQQLLIPDPNEELPTSTPVPLDFRGTVEYIVLLGDTLTGIALKFNSTVEAIIEENEGLTEDNVNEIGPGQVLLVPVNLVTPGPTNTPAGLVTPGAIATLTATAAPTNTP